MSGSVSHHAGLSAEGIVEVFYQRLGKPVLERRWRGQAGEIDLILADGDGVIFVEVKKARDHATAAARLSPRQQARIYAAASEFLATRPLGQLTEARIDVALVDALGRVDVIENALGQ